MNVVKSSRVSYLGVPGSYSHQATKFLFPKSELFNQRSFSDVVNDVQNGITDIAVVPVENSIAGRVADVHSIMLSTDLLIVCEHLLKIEHCLIVNNDEATDLSSIEKIYSHPQALTQCKKFISENLPNAEKINTSDTASAVKKIVELGQSNCAAIGSIYAAKEYKASIVAHNIADISNNTTRFLALTSEENINDELATGNISTLIFQVKHEPGALIKALSTFEENDVNIMKLETYMVSGDISNPTFYIDIGAGLHEDKLKKALRQLTSCTIYIKFLGSYKASDARSSETGFLKIK